MKIIAGDKRGTRIKTLEGLRTRPTAARVKEAVFSSLQGDIYGSKVLDLFAGSGAIGFEFLSRGADYAALVDSSKKAQGVISANIRKLGFSKENCRPMHMSYLIALDYFAKQGFEFDIIYIDPPFGSDICEKAVRAILGLQLLAPSGIIVCEQEISDPKISDEILSVFRSTKQKKYGSISITIMKGD